MNDSQEFFDKWLCPTYDDIVDKIKLEQGLYCEFEKKHRNLQNSLLHNYNQKEFVYLMNYKRDYFLALVRRIIDFFPQFNCIPYIAFFHGSYGRNISRFGSDMDLNILFDNDFINVMKPINELICSMLYQIVKFKGRDKIHGIMVNAKPLRNFKYSFKNGTQYKVLFLDGKIFCYNSRKYFENDMTRIQNASNSFEDFKKYILSNCTSNFCFEWCYSFWYICSNCDEYNLNSVVTECDNKIRNESDIFAKTIRLLDKIKKDIISYEFDFDEISISKLNKEYKCQILGFIYNIISLIRRCLVIRGYQLGCLDVQSFLNSNILKDFIGTKEVTELKDIVYYYNWSLSRLEELMYYNDYNFSSREPTLITKEKLDEDYKNMYGVCFYEFHNAIVLKVKNILVIILNKVRGEMMKNV